MTEPFDWSVNNRVYFHAERPGQRWVADFTTWRGFEDVEMATLDWVARFKQERLPAPPGYVPPTEFEAQYDVTRYAHASAGALYSSRLPEPGAVQNDDSHARAVCPTQYGRRSIVASRRALEPVRVGERRGIPSQGSWLQAAVAPAPAPKRR